MTLLQRIRYELVLRRVRRDLRLARSRLGLQPLTEEEHKGLLWRIVDPGEPGR